MLVKKDGDYSVKRDGSSYYRVFRKRTRIGSFLSKSVALEYMDWRKEKDGFEKK